MPSDYPNLRALAERTQGDLYCGPKTATDLGRALLATLDMIQDEFDTVDQLVHDDKCSHCAAIRRLAALEEEAERA